MDAGESLLWCRDPFECFESRDSLDELFDDDELLRLDDDLLLLLPLELVVWPSFVLVLLWVCGPSTTDAFIVSELTLLDELLVFIFDADCFDGGEVFGCVDDEEFAVLLLVDFRWLVLCDPF